MKSTDKRDAYIYLDLKVTATLEGADIKRFLDPSLLNNDSFVLTTGQTSGCLFRCIPFFNHVSPPLYILLDYYWTCLQGVGPH